MASTNPLVEYWTYLAIVIVVVAGWIAARWQTVGFRDLAPDDYLMVVAILPYTAETATAHWDDARATSLCRPHIPRVLPSYGGK